MPKTTDSYAITDNDISELVNILAEHTGPYEIITAKAGLKQPQGVNWAIASINGKSVRYRYHSSPSTIISALLRHSRQPVTINGTRLQTHPFADGMNPEPFARFTRQTGNIHTGEIYRVTARVGDQFPPILHLGLSFSVPEQWAPEHDFSPQDTPNVVHVSFPDHQQDHPNYQADITAVVYPAYTLDYTHYHDYAFFTSNDKPVIVPDAVSRRLMGQQAIQQTHQVLEQYRDHSYPDADIQRWRIIRSKAEHTGDYDIGSSPRTCYVNLKPHAIPALIKEDCAAVRDTIHNALRGQTEYPYVPCQRLESHRDAARKHATIRMDHARILRASERQPHLLTTQQLQDEASYYGPADEIVLNLVVSQDGQPDQTIQVPTQHYIAGTEAAFIVYATPDLGITAHEFADLIFDILGTQSNEFDDDSDFRTTCEVVAINATMHPDDAFRQHLQRLADSFQPGVPFPAEPVSITGTGFRLTFQSTR